MKANFDLVCLQSDARRQRRACEATPAIICNNPEILWKGDSLTCGQRSAECSRSPANIRSPAFPSRGGSTPNGALASMLRLLAVLPVLLPATAGAFDWRDHGRSLPSVIGERDPSDPAERVPRTGYQSVTAATRTYRPVAPLPWDELNRRVTPRPKAEPPAGQQK